MPSRLASDRPIKNVIGSVNQIFAAARKGGRMRGVCVCGGGLLVAAAASWQVGGWADLEGWPDNSSISEKERGGRGAGGRGGEC